MATLNDLETLDTSAPVDLEDWLGRFSEDDRELVVEKIMTARTNDVYPIISRLDKNPYPFERSTLNHHRRVLRGGK